MDETRLAGIGMGVRALSIAVILSVAVALGSCATPTFDPVDPPTAGPTAFPTHLAFEPQITMPPRATPTLLPSPQPLPSQGPLSLPTLISPSTDIPLPRLCLLPSFAGILAQLPGCTSYSIVLEIDPDSAHVKGSQVIDYTNTEPVPLESILLRLFPNAPHYGGAISVTNTIVNDRPVTTALEVQDTVLRVPLETPLAPGGRVIISMDFGVNVPTTRASGFGLFSYVNGVMALPNVYPVIPVYDDAGWHVEVPPNFSDDPFTDIAAYSVRITAPPTMTLVASGTCTGIGSGVWECDASPMRDFMLVLSDKFVRVARTSGNVVINSYYYEGVQRSGQLALDIATDAVTAYTDYFGDYPYSELDVVMTPNLLGGMEYPGLVAVKDAYYYGNPVLEWIVAHEVGHQWWYVVVGSDQVNQPWLDETLTSYSTMLYYEHLYGKQRGIGIVNGEFRATYRKLQAAGHAMPVGLPAKDYTGTTYWDVIYREGPLYYDALRTAVGDDAFFQILKTYYAENRFGIATPQRLLDAIRQVTGDRHIDLYTRWITGGG